MTEGERFAEIARRYCAFVETAANISTSERVFRARQLLLELVQIGAQLPDGDASGSGMDHDVTTPGDWPGFGELDIYWEVFDPYQKEPPVAGSLSDDLLDTYLDVRRGLAAHDAGSVDSAIWEWKFHFDHHWGDHAVDALRALQRACMRVADPSFREKEARGDE